MKKLLLRTILLTGIIATTIPVQAQWRVGLQAGYTSNTLEVGHSYDYDRRHHPMGGFTISAPVEYGFYDWLGVRAELSFIQKGHKIHRTEYFNGLYTNTRNNYLQLPIMARFSFGGERVRGFVHAGGYIGYWLSSHVSGRDIRYFDDEQGDNSGLITPENSYDFDQKNLFNNRRDNCLEAGILGGAGVAYRITPRAEIQAEVRYYYSLTDIQKQYMKFQSPRYNTTLAAQIGCMITLGKIK